MENLNETFIKIYLNSRLEESKTSLLNAMAEFKKLTNDAGEESSRTLRMTRDMDVYIQRFECDFVYILKCIENEPLLGNIETQNLYYNAIIKSAKNTFKDNNIEGLNILGDRLPDNFMFSYYKTYEDDILNKYTAKGMSSRVKMAI